MPKKIEHKDIFTYLKNKHGIDYSYFAKILGMSPQGFEYARKRGLNSNERRIIQNCLKLLSVELKDIEI
jgi:hypothetical protein